MLNYKLLKSIILILHCYFSVLNTLSLQKCPKEYGAQIQIVETKNGKLNGSCIFVDVTDDKELSSGNVYSWLGIPYAEVPINANRFQRPIPIKSWSDPLDATKIPNSCVQHYTSRISDKIFQTKNNNMSEDCLYLNVWSPEKAIHNFNMKQQQNEKLFPILVFFPGTESTSMLDIYDPSILVTVSEIIVVTVNYRVGIFGFLNLNNNNNNNTTNNGLFDQYLALKWISENAAVFGGDSSRITIWSHGNTGTQLVSYHLFHKPSWSLFNNIILQSGSILNSDYVISSVEEASNRTNEFMPTHTNCTKEIFKCLQKIPSHQLVSIQSLNDKLFQPVIDGQFISDTPLNLLKTNKFKQCNMITGFVQNEGGYDLAKKAFNLLSHQNSKPVVNFKHLNEYLQKHFNNNSVIMNTILFEYTRLTMSNRNDAYLMNTNYFNLLEKLAGDFYCKCGVFNLADYYSKKNQVYLYSFDHRISSSVWPKNLFNSTVHADDLAIMFGHLIGDESNQALIDTFNPWRIIDNNLTKSMEIKAERYLTREILTHFANFIYFNNPNMPNNKYKSNQSVKNWPLYAQLNILPR